ncbi:acyl-CoA dehydrogenase family protein [Rhodococcus wratislaviensis]|uniref:acyl-CoA dehydrogenase family protein n=1 Tax=Rhodococcus wratislaviensis TaxID=44752 RepID=UPI003513D605
MSATATHVETITAPRQFDRLYHDDLSPADVRQVRARVRALADEIVAPEAHRIATGDERVDGFPRRVFDDLARAGLLRIPFRGDVGGDDLDHPATATAAAAEELAYHSNSIAAIFDVDCILAGNALTHGTAEQQERWLAPLVAGEHIGSFATSEPGASSDLSPAAVQTIAERTDTGWILNGRKRWITNSPVAAFVVVLARTGDRLTTFIVPTDTTGVTVGLPDRKVGNRGQLTADVVFTDVALDEAHVLGEIGGGLRIALQTLVYGRIGIGAAGVGMAQAAFDQLAKHLSERHTFGKPLGAHQHWQFVIAEYATQLEVARSTYLKAALRLDAGHSFPEPEAAMAKLLGTRLSVDIARDAAQAFGAMGFVEERGADAVTSVVATIYRDSKIGEIYEGANEIQKWVIARTVLGRDIAG